MEGVGAGAREGKERASFHLAATGAHHLGSHTTGFRLLHRLSPAPQATIGTCLLGYLLTVSTRHPST